MKRFDFHDMADANKFVLIKPKFQYENISLTSYSLSNASKENKDGFFCNLGTSRGRTF